MAKSAKVRRKMTSRANTAKAALARDERRLLVVEDELPLLALLCDTFAAEGFEVLVAKNGHEGLAVAFSERPDLIILDILMPEMSGLDVLRRLRSDRYKWGRYVPVIILSNLSNHETIAEGLKHANDYLVKADWTLSDLVSKVKEKLERNHV